MILSGSAVHVKGFDCWLCSSRKLLIAAWRSATERNTPRFSRRFVSMAKKPSTALSHDAEVGVKWNVQRGWLASQLAHLGMFVGSIIIDDGVDHFSNWRLSLDGIEEANEFLMAMALHVAADHRTVEDIQCSE
jgi:hypothetical protein